MNHLDKTKLWGKAIRVMPSKHTTVQLPKDGQPDAGLTKDYGNSNLHRFKKPGSKNYSNIYPPSSTLHLSNIPTTVEEPHLREAFGNIGLHVQAFKFFPKDRKMALVQLANVDEAIIALVKLHNCFAAFFKFSCLPIHLELKREGDFRENGIHDFVAERVGG